MTDQQPSTDTAARAAHALDEEDKSRRVSLADVCAKGAAHFAHKRYDEAAECYARAAGVQAELDGEMDPRNAEVLFLYGRSLFKVGQGKSDVLGGKAAGKEKKGKGKEKEKRAVGEGVKEKKGDRAEKSEKAEEGEEKDEEGASGEKKPLFQFEGDENWDDTDEEDEDEEDDEEQEEEDDDLATAFDVLDLARVLFTKRLEELDATEEAEKEHVEATIRHVRERLADTHDLLSEISLENESYPAAITDARASLAHKKTLHPPESEVLAEAHFKLSLALEYASITTTEEAAAGAGVGSESVVDQAQRDEACEELGAAIESTRLKMGKKEAELAATGVPEEGVELRGEIGELKEIIGDMEERLKDLRGPPIDINETLYGADGLLGAAAAGASAAKVQDAKKNATDLSSLVRKKGKEGGPGEKKEGEGNGKRKAEGGEGEGSKKAKVEEA